MRADDLAAVHRTRVLAFDALDRQEGRPPESGSDQAAAEIRLRHLLRTDPGGAWVAEEDGEVAGAALALVRDGLWGLSLLVVRPGSQSAGLGRELLGRAYAYGAGAAGHVVLASSDPRALRAYARLGLALHPAMSASGVPRAVVAPPELRPGDEADFPLLAEIDRHVRGAAHGKDVAAMLAAGSRLLVLPGRGYAVVRPDGASPQLLAAFTPPDAAAVLRGVLAGAGERSARVEWLTSAQQWAMTTCVEAGLDLSGEGGAVFLGGRVGPFAPYLPSGAYL